MNEVWKPVIGFENLYDVSNRGRVRSHHASTRNEWGKYPIILSPGNVRGYRQVHLRKDGVGRSGLIHRLVAEAFIGAPPTPEHEVNHKNFDKSDNRPDNLEWITHAENTRYSALVIPRNRGETNHSKLTEAQVVEIRRRHATNEANFTQLAAEYGVALQTISAIVKRAKWKHVA